MIVGVAYALLSIERGLDQLPRIKTLLERETGA